ncbi:MAG: Zn-dependent hydrolase [Bacteroidetes bacterium]|nr:MAG: Zn-dependent hydrolase [Bacteroidota bacterium]
MHRRIFIKQSCLVAAGVGVVGNLLAHAAPPATALRVNGKRIETRIFELAKFGLDDKGRGYRVAYTNGDVQGRAWFMNLMQKAGLNPSIDAAGNIVGRRSGSNPLLKPIAFGSHIDMVPDGGNYDGTLGSIAALEVIEVLNENNIVTQHPLEVIIFANEEGGTIGSQALTDGLTPAGLAQKSPMGLTVEQGIRAIGGNPNALASCLRKKGDLKAFLELHIEQGGILEREKLQIGVVQGIVGIVHWEVTVQGFANHAGTTPMNQRQDALLAASKFIVAVNRVATAQQGNQVGTVGKIEVQPGAYNVVPGKVILGLEIRDLSAAKIENLFAQMQQRATAIAAETKTTISFNRQANAVAPALTSPAVQKVVETAAKSLGLSTKYMQSGAGHDAQHMAHIAPTGMIFVPSIGGISHSPKEYSTPADMANGANVLLQAIFQLDKS